MSKGNMLLGHARGKVGSLVFSRADGKQIVRSRAEVVKNPRTESQMIQRVLLNTVAQAYSGFKSITDHSYQGVSEGQKTMSIFMQRNLNILRQKVASERAAGKNFVDINEFSPLKSNYLALNEYEISKGTLPAIAVVALEDSRDMAIALSANTYEAIINDYNLKRGDQMTFCAITLKGLKREFTFARVILDPRDAEGKELPLTTAFAQSNKVVSPSDRNEGAFTRLQLEGGNLVFGFGGEATTIIGACVIVSRRNADGTWLRSNASIVMNDQESYAKYNMQNCLDMIEDASLATLSDMYLNNAGTGNVSGKTTTGGNTGGGGTGGGPSQEG